MTDQSRPRIAIFGAGAIGLYLACRLEQAGMGVTLITRPGKALPLPIILDDSDGTTTRHHPGQHPADQPTPQDYVIVTVKAQDLPAALPQIRPWLGDGGQLVAAQNGLPWWFLHRLAPGTPLRAADPDGTLLRSVDLNRTIACVINKSVDRLAANHIKVFSANGDRFVFGRPLGPVDDAIIRLTAVLTAAGLTAQAVDDIVPPLWDKLLGNVVLNPLSAITGLDMGTLLADPARYQRLVAGMQEARAVARANALPPGIEPEERLARTARIGAKGHFRTSMLQDRQAGRPLELEPIIGAVLELARRHDVPTPVLTRLYADVLAGNQSNH